MTDLAAHHLTLLRQTSGISDEVIAVRGYRTITDEAELAAMGFAPRQRRVPGLLLPLHTTNGRADSALYRPDNPRLVENHRQRHADGTHPQHAIEYEMPQGQTVQVDCPPLCRPQLADSSIPLFITDGQKKADALVSRGACAIALTGIWNWKSRSEYGGTTFTNDLGAIAWKNRPVYLVFDSDVMTRQGVRQALERFTDHLKRKQAVVSHIYLPPLHDGQTGVDDWLVATGKGIPDLVALAVGPRPEPKAAAPKVELLDEAPARMTRPLALINGRAYVATWCYVRVTQTETQKKDGTIVRHDPPRQSHEKRLFIIRDDGVIFGEGGQKPHDKLALELVLPEIPLAEKLLSTPGLKAYAKGYRAEATAVFHQLRAIISRFIDFDHSLADQETMADFIACYILATWFLDAFTVSSYLWPNGDRGSGKTQLLILIAELSYLGYLIQASGSFAALRDLADYGATLAFDDAEDLAEPRSTSAEKRALLLAGNRRGSTIPLKEKDANQNWVTRHVNTFSFRLFSAIHLPDNVLASRTIIVPLIRTPDRYRANADPLEEELWPHPKRPLLDDLWRLALTHLLEMKQVEAVVNQEARLTGRNLEPWRAILAVARWLDGQGCIGLWLRLEQLSWQYQNERPQLETDDFTSLVIRGLAQLCANCARCANCANHVENTGGAHWLFCASQLAEQLVEMAADDAQISLERQMSRKIGIALHKMRLQKPPRSGGQGNRHWLITLTELKRWTAAYGISLPESLAE
ncbi:MAG: DUF3854 domain-containing protein [Chloroflexi bacterium]|nr:DUF3854 domain-containing protein [Chloroflexota bacterium]